MSTNATVVFMDGKEPVLMLYKHYDGGDFGDELREYFKGFRVTDGLGIDTDKVANGMSCLALQAVAHFKTQPGDLYLCPLDTEEDSGYHYVISVKDGAVIVEEFNGNS